MSFHPDLLYLTDTNSGQKFFVDTGAVISFFPATDDERRHGRQGAVVGGLGQTMKTFGSKELTLEIGLGRKYTWQFCLSDFALLGADFLGYYHLIVDVRNRIVVDEPVRLHRCGLGPKPSETLPPTEERHMDRRLWQRVKSPGEARRKRVLIDTGASHSFVPATEEEKGSHPNTPAQRGEAFKDFFRIHGTRQVQLHVRALNRCVKWPFMTGDPIKIPVIGCDFLKHYGLCVDLHERRLLPPLPDTLDVMDEVTVQDKDEDGSE